MKARKSFYSRCVTWLGSRTFFWIIVSLLVLQAGWIALTARYPQAFDEQYHFGISQLYTGQYSPFFTEHPDGADQFSALTADPSFMYHYLLSFPLRWVMHATSSQTIQVIILRLLSVALFAWALTLFRKLFLSIKVPPAITNVVLLFYVLTPVTPLLAAQINYDNLMIPLTVLSFIYAIRLLTTLREDGRFSAWDFMLFLVCGLLGATVKYPFLPILAGLVLIVVYGFWRRRAGLWQNVRQGYKSLSTAKKTALGLLVALLIGMNLFTYGGNLLRYHTLAPSCDRVLSTEQCKHFLPWARDYQLVQEMDESPSLLSVVPYPGTWISQMIRESVFTVSSAYDDDGTTVLYFVGEPLPVMKVLAWVVFVAGMVLSVYYWRRLWQNYPLRVFLLVGLFYAAALLAQNIEAYLRTGQPVAIHGRYLLPILPMIYLSIALCFSWLIRRFFREKSTVVSVWLFIIVLLASLQGGGIVTYIIRSDDSWSWQQSPAAIRLNASARKALGPFVLGS